MPDAKRLLVNYWYAHPVGHAIEGLRYALGYSAADPSLPVSLLLNGATPVELANCCAFLDQVYAVPFTTFTGDGGDPLAALVDVPREWDYVVNDSRVAEPEQHQFSGFHRFYEAAHIRFRPRHAFGYAGAEPPAYLWHSQLRLELPSAAQAAARRTIGERTQAIAVVLAGSSAPHLYPSASSWELILSELSARHPGFAICLIGKLARDGRTTTTFARETLDRLLRAIPATLDCFDRPLLEQVALVEASRLLVSPHTGFAFTASTVGTPWLALSGGDWHEYFFNGVPVYSVLPDTDRYPCFAWAELGVAPLPVIAADEDGEGPRTPSMSAARIREDLPELLHGAEILINRRLGYEQALADYFPRLLAAYKGDRSRVFSFDDVHELYL